MTLRRLMGEAGGALSRRRFLAGAGAASWCGACMPVGEHPSCSAPANVQAARAALPVGDDFCVEPRDDIGDFLDAGYVSYVPAFPPAWQSARFRILYESPTSTADVARYEIIRIGRAQLPLGTVVAGGPPRSVQLACLSAFKALETFLQHGYRKPADFFIVVTNRQQDLGRGETSPTTRSIIVERALTADQMFLTCGHEIMHRIQYAYCVTADELKCSDRPGIRRYQVAMPKSFREGGARFAEALLLAENERRLRPATSGWFSQPQQALAPSCALPSASRRDSTYTSGLFWAYMAEQHGRLAGGADTQTIILETAAKHGGRLDLEVLREARAAMRGPGHFDQFAWLDAGTRQDPVSTETTWGNFLVALAANDRQTGDSRFRLPDSTIAANGAREALRLPRHQIAEFDDLPAWRPLSGSPEADARQELVVERGPWVRERTYDGLRPILAPLRGAPLLPESEVPPPVMLPPFAFSAWRIMVPDDGATRLLRVRANAVCGLQDAMVQVALFERSGRLLDLVRGPLPSFLRVIACRDAVEICVIIASCERAGDFVLGLSRIVEPRPVLAISDWNCISGRSLTVDPASLGWTWHSPDLAPIERHGISYRIRNVGTYRARRVALEFQRMPCGDPASGWKKFDTVLIDRMSLIEDCDRRQMVYQERFGDGHGAECNRSAQFVEGAVYWPAGPPPDDYFVRVAATCANDPNHTTYARLSPGGIAPRTPRYFRFT